MAKAPNPNKKLDDRESRFVDEYLIDLDTERAAVAASYSVSTARSKAYQWVSNGKVKPHVFAEVKKRQKLIAEKAEVNALWVLNRLVNIVSANPNELTSVQVGSCRYCHGEDHGYQWRTEGEFLEAQEAYWELPDGTRNKTEAPVISGGYGFSSKAPPHPDCPHCEGIGQHRTILGDTTRLSPQALDLFAGVKETNTGIEVKTQDKMKALEMIARHVNFFEKETASAAGALADALTEIQARTSKAPLNRGKAEK